MKPIIIYAEEKDDKVTITKAELQRIVDEAYKQGKADGNVYTTSPSHFRSNIGRIQIDGSADMRDAQMEK